MQIRLIYCTYHTKRSRVIVMKLVNVLIKWAIVKSTMSPVVPEILKEEEDSDLESHCLPIVYHEMSLYPMA
jgi:hypothetical protein